MRAVTGFTTNDVVQKAVGLIDSYDGVQRTARPAKRFFISLILFNPVNPVKIPVSALYVFSAVKFSPGISPVSVSDFWTICLIEANFCS